MSTVDPAVVRAQRRESQKGGIGSLLTLMVAATGSLVGGYLAGRGFAGIFGVFRWMESQGINELSMSQSPPYFWGLFVGIFAGVPMVLLYKGASQTFTGGAGLPVNGASLFAVAVAGGVWVQGVDWAEPDSYSSYGSGSPGWGASFWEASDRWLPITCAVVAGLVVIASIWLWARQGTKGEQVRQVLDTGRRARGVVTEAAWTGVEINDRKVIRFTVKFTDHAGVQRWVTKKATFDPVAMPSAGRQATVFYDPARLDEDKIFVTLEPLEVVEQKLRDAAEPSVSPRAERYEDPPAWGSPSDGFYRGDTGSGYYRGDAGY